MNFIVPIDFSINAKIAAKYAMLLAQATNADIRLLHIIEPPLIGTDKREARYKEKVSLAKEEAAIKLEKLCEELNEESINVKCDYVVRVAESSSEIIVSAALNNKADFIVMGTRGAGAIKKIILGSNTASVIEDSPIPVFVIPEEVSFFNPKKIVFASRFHNSDVQAIKQLSFIASAFNAELIIVHFIENKKGKEAGSSIMAIFLARIREVITYPKITCHTFENENAQKGIEKFIDVVDADIIALSTKNRNPIEKLFSRSMTKDMSFHSKIPLLAFHIKNIEDDYEI
jgi:nucleotide-binding universal stress UspA family protein